MLVPMPGIEKLEDLKMERMNNLMYDKAIDDFQEWLKTQIVGLDNTTNEILVVVDNRWELATDKFKECCISWRD